MKFLRYTWCLLLALVLVACGGGGGPDTSVKVPTLTVSLVDGTESIVADRSLSATDARYIKVVLRTKAGGAAAYTPVSLTLSGTTAVLLPAEGQKLTDANGVALIKISPADPSQGFVLRVTAAASVESASLSSTLALQFSGGGTVITGSPTMDVSLVDVSGAAIANNALSRTAERSIKVVLKTKSGAFPPSTRVTLTLDSTDATLVPSNGIAYTGVDGSIKIKISPSSTAGGGVLVTATASVESVVLTKLIDLSISEANVSFGVPQPTPASVLKGQSLNVKVAVKVDGNIAPPSSVPVTFVSSCGTVTPTPALVDSSGNANAVLQTTSAGAACTVTASSAGTVSQSGIFIVNDPPTTNLSFISVVPTLIYQKGSVGVNQSIVKFKVITATGDPAPGEVVTATLPTADPDLNYGITFCGPLTASATSDPGGIVSFTVCGGTSPTTVQVRANLSNPAIATVSNLLAVQSGLPSQKGFGLSVSQPNFLVGAGFTGKVDGNTTTITATATDRLGNPVPSGTTVVFVTSGGLVISAEGKSSCVISDSTGSCSVTLRGQEYRPLGSMSTKGNSPTGPGGDRRPGRVTVLAYTDGEEDFFDAIDNNNNRWDGVRVKDGVSLPAEMFDDLGRMYLDKDNNGVYEAGYTNTVTGAQESDIPLSMPLGSVGTSTCSPTDLANPGLSVEGTCNGIWNGNTRVRKSVVIVFSGDAIAPACAPLAFCPYNANIPSTKFTQTISKSNSAVTVQLADLNGNPLPADASIAVSVVPANDTSTCSASLSDTAIGNSIEPTRHTAKLTTCGAGDTVVFKVTTSTSVSDYSVSL